MALEMSDDEIDDFLSHHHRLRLGTVSGNGWPHVIPVSYTRLDASPTLYVHSHPESRKSRNLRHDNRVGAVIDEGVSYGELRGVFVHGYATAIRDPERMRELEASWKEKLHGGERPELLKRAHAQHGTTMWIRIDPANVVTWDNTKLDPDRLPPVPEGESADFTYDIPDDLGAAEPEIRE